MNPKYPVYIVSKGRWESRLTSKTLERINVPYRIVVEPQEYDEYAAVIEPNKILKLPFSNLGQGSIPARNYVWDHALSEKQEWHWILDDNIRHFYRINKNKFFTMDSGTTFKVIEDFVNRYENIAQAGMQYKSFMPRRWKKPPFCLNTRIYSCILIKNNIPYRWRGKYNEDTDLSLRILKDGLCTILFNAFPCGKETTMIMKGGNTEDLYNLDKEDGRLKMAQSLCRQHPDVTRIIRRWGRWQHHVDYRSFKHNKLILKDDVVISKSTNNYGMKLIRQEKEFTE